MPFNPSTYRSKEEYVHDLFSSIAHRYDLLNTILSFNQDKYWRRFAAAQTGLKPGGRGLDVCCGTGMLTLELARLAGPQGGVVGVDFCARMLERARENIARTPYVRQVVLVYGNAVDLPFPDNTFDCATIGFALRNVPDICRTIAEMARVVKPGGRVVSLELSKPGLPLFKQLYYLYFNYLVPLLGRLWAGKGDPYRYLPRSLRDFPHQRELGEIFARAGLLEVKWYELTGGIVSVHVGTVP